MAYYINKYEDIFQNLIDFNTMIGVMIIGISPLNLLRTRMILLNFKKSLNWQKKLMLSIIQSLNINHTLPVVTVSESNEDEIIEDQHK